MAHPRARARQLPSLLAGAALLLLAASETRAARLPGPLVYVVTASPAPAPRRLQIDAAPSRGVSYSGGRRRSDTPDLIFAEFEADGGREGDAPRKSIRKLLENERIRASTSRPAAPTSAPSANTSDLIFAEFEAGKNREKSVKALLSKERIGGDSASAIMSPPKFSTSNVKNHKDEHHAVYNNLFEDRSPLGPVVVSEPETTGRPTTEAAMEEDETLAPMRVEDIWHVINNEQEGGQGDLGEVGEQGDRTGGWEEVPLSAQPTVSAYFNTVDENEANTEPPSTTTQSTVEDPYGYNFVFPGFGSQDDKSTENESRAIRTESNIRFPYVNLKTYQMKGRPTNKKGNNLYTSVDKFRDEKNPLRGEAQDAGPSLRPQIDRYNPAQPYLPPSPYGSTNKQSPAAPPKPVKTVANLIPPPPPPPPRRAPDFASPPDTYESFPPYAPPPPPPAPPKPLKPVLSYRPPPPPPPPSDDNSDAGPPPSTSGGDDDSAPPPAAPADSDDGGYDYKPPSSGDGGYDYSPPSSGGYSYSKPPQQPLAPPPDDPEPPAPPSPPADDAPHFTGYSYKKPHGVPADTDYPELIYSKPHMPKPPMMGGDMVKGVEMMPPPPPMDKPDFPNLSFDSSPPDDAGYKHHYHHHHDFEDYEHHPHHHHTTTTTTTTTEMPRVNRFSYYYLGKKLYYLPLYFSVYFVVYVGALIIKAVLRHKIVYPNSWHAPSRRRRELEGVEGASLAPERLHEVTRRVTNALMMAAEKYAGSERT